MGERIVIQFFRYRFDGAGLLRGQNIAANKRLKKLASRRVGCLVKNLCHAVGYKAGRQIVLGRIWGARGHTWDNGPTH